MTEFEKAWQYVSGGGYWRERGFNKKDKHGHPLPAPMLHADQAIRACWNTALGAAAEMAEEATCNDGACNCDPCRALSRHADTLRSLRTEEKP